jgi:hypothetical protein
VPLDLINVIQTVYHSESESYILFQMTLCAHKSNVLN